MGEVVIVGGGHGGVQAAASLRQYGYRGGITIVSDEPGLPYQRPHLSKSYLAGALAADGLLLRSIRFYDEQAISLVTDVVESVDRSDRCVRLESGVVLHYEQLILATGARNRPLGVPGMDLDGVLGLRTLADADCLRERFRKAERIVVIGAGFIGLECAAVACGLGLEVTVVEALERPMSRALSAHTAEHLALVHRRNEVRLHFGSEVTRLIAGRDALSSNQVVAVELSTGTVLRADLVTVGIGVVPNVELATASGLEVDDGIVVDEHLQTSDAAIFAIGDCARYPSTHARRAVRLESVQNAVDQGRCVAACILGEPARYGALPWFWSEQFDIKLQIAGLATAGDRALAMRSKDPSRFSVLRFAGDRLVAVESVNRPGDHAAARRMLAREQPITATEAGAASFELTSAYRSG